MKKFGFLIFAAAIVVGVIVSGFFSFGKASQKFFSFSVNETVKGSGNVTTESRDLSDFNSVEVGGVFEVEITAGQDFAVEVEADDNLLPLIRTNVHNGVLHIEAADRIKNSNGLKVRISAPNIEQVQASGASRVNLSAVNNEELRVFTSGASKMHLSGESAKLDLEVSGAGSVDAEELKTANAQVNASGASHVSVFAAEELRADASGASRISYSGEPKNIVRHTSGASSVRAN
jgi:hypothetical protein